MRMGGLIYGVLAIGLCGCVHPETSADGKRESQEGSSRHDVGHLDDTAEPPEEMVSREFVWDDFHREARADAEAWTWPSSEQFKEIWRLRASTEPLRLVLGTIHFQPSSRVEGCRIREEYEIEEVIVGLVERGEEAELVGVFAPDYDRWSYLSAMVEMSQEVVTALDASTTMHPPTYVSACGVVTLTPTHVAPHVEIDVRRWSDWVYATTLMTFGEPLYEESEQEEVTLDWKAVQELRAELAEASKARRNQLATDLLARKFNRRDHLWSDILTGLLEDGEDDLARRVFRWFRPMGRCSMDFYPAELAGQYAEFCASHGDLSCYMKLQLKIMGNRFDRMAWSSMGERAHRPSAAELFKAPVNADRFLRGALLRYASGTERIEVGAWRLARAVGNAGLDEVLDALVMMAGDADLDEANRLMATQFLYFLSDEDYGALSHRAAKAVGESEPSPITAHWLDAQRRAKDL